MRARPSPRKSSRPWNGNLLPGTPRRAGRLCDRRTTRSSRTVSGAKPLLMRNAGFRCPRALNGIQGAETCRLAKELKQVRVNHSLPDGSLEAKTAPLKSARRFSDSDSFSSLFFEALFLRPICWCRVFFRKLKYYLKSYRYP